MRKIHMYSIYDLVSEVFSEFPFPGVNDNDAIRGFTNGVNAPENKTNPLDYSLYNIGVYDRITGNIETHKEPKLLITGREVIQTKTEKEN